MLGGSFTFDLFIIDSAGFEEDTEQRPTNHNHNDNYFAALAGTVDPDDGGFTNYLFGVSGRHTEFFFTPMPIPEPGTFVLLALGFVMVWLLSSPPKILS